MWTTPTVVTPGATNLAGVSESTVGSTTESLETSAASREDADTGATLPLTGERTVPGIPEENYWFRRHEVVYRDLLPRCA